MVKHTRLLPLSLALSVFILSFPLNNSFLSPDRNRSVGRVRISVVDDRRQVLALRSSLQQQQQQQQGETEIKTKPKRKVHPRVPVITYHDDWVCVNKPAGVSVHKSNRNSREKVLTSLLKRQLARKVFPVHRLDHRTSGAILFAFNSETCALLHKSLTSKSSRDEDDAEEATETDDNDENGGRAVKEYVALCRGQWKFPEKTMLIDKPLNIQGVEKTARTRFTLLASFAGTGGGDVRRQQDKEENDDDDDVSDDEKGAEFSPACSLIRCEPITGRTHQIRRHAFYLGHPIIGDSEHGDSRVNRWWRENWGLNRLALHSFSLDLPPLARNDNDEESAVHENNVVNEGAVSTDDDTTKERIKCVAPLSPELISVLKRDELKEMWEEAVRVDERLILEPVDVRKGTHGRHFRSKEQ